MIYLVYTFLFLIPVFIYDFHPEKKKNMPLFYMEALLIILLYGLRYHVGADSLVYEYKFDEMPSLSELNNVNWGEMRYQPLWYLFVALIKNLGGNFYVLCFVQTAFVTIVFFSTIKRYTSFIYSAVVAYFVVMSPLFCTEILREAIAVSFFLISLPALLEKKWIQYYILSIVAFLFHTGALLLLILPLLLPFLSKTWKIKSIIISTGVIIILSIFVGDIISNFLNLAVIGVSDESRVMVYMDIVAENQGSTKGIGGTSIGLKWLLSIFMYIFVIFVNQRTNVKNDAVGNIALNMEFSLNLLLYVLGTVAQRWTNYFDLIFYISLINIIFNKKLRQYSLGSIYKIILVLYFSFVTYDYYTGVPQSTGVAMYERYVPYSSILNPSEYKPREIYYK